MFAWIRTLVSRTRTWFSPGRADQDFEQEMESHIEMLAEENMRRGMEPEEAKRAARVRLGGITQLKETNRDLRGLPFLETLWQDVRYAFRMLRKNPGFTAVAVLTLALGIGANTAIFSVLYAVLLKPLPYVNSDQLFTVFQALPHEGVTATGMSYANFEDLRQQNRVFLEMAGTQNHQLTLTGRGEPSVVNASIVTSEFFALFEEPPLAGRIFASADGKPGAPAVVILSEGLWRRVFGADRRVVGTSVDLDKRSFTIVGVMPSRFRFPLITESEQVWIPLAQDPLFGSWMTRRGGHWLRIIARLRPGVSQAQVRAEMGALAGRLAKAFPAENTGWVLGTMPLQRMLTGDVKSGLVALLGAVGLVLLIACANIANLVLARATSREREIAVRSTLGAGRVRIARQLLTETAMLSLLGGLAGMVLAFFGVQALDALLPANVPRVNAIQIDYPVLGFALLLCAFAACAVGLLPAFLVAKSDLQASLREGGGRVGESAKGRRARNVFAAAEIGLAVVLLVAAGLVLRSFAKLLSVNPGFAVQHLMKAEVSLPQAQYSAPEQWVAFSDDLLARVKAEPGLHDSALAVPIPLADGYVNLAFDIVGHPLPPSDLSRTADFVSVSPDYFHVMEVPLLAGRLFDDHDRPAARHVTIINRQLARTYFPNEDPVGKRLSFAFPGSTGDPVREIVGIVGDVRDVSLGADPGPMMYVPFAQSPFWGAGIVLRTALSPASVSAAIRREVGKIDKDLPVSDFAPMTDVVDASLGEPRVRTFLLALFAGIALALAATGIFGVISYSVSCRTHEIGIRVALGASPAVILGMVSRETLALTLGGLAAGLAGALAASRLLGHILFGVAAYDPATLVGASLVLGAVSVIAAYVPARRAMRVDPML
ncbi:MAG TPA: ABC transporter permease, partial [Methylomirabilota bacterium]|nr:ABC transporter permease [Methylomirabilota bacterium]